MSDMLVVARSSYAAAAAMVVLRPAFPVDTPVRYAVYPWVATVIQGSTDSFEVASNGNRPTWNALDDLNRPTWDALDERLVLRSVHPHCLLPK